MNLLKNFRESFLNDIENIDFSLENKEIGKVIKIDGVILYVSGFSRIMYNEAVVIAEKYIGFVSYIKEDLIKVVLLNKTNSIKINDNVERLKKILEIPVGYELIGRVVDSLGQFIDNKENTKIYKKLPVERKAKEIFDRKEVNIPLETGIKIIDCFIPVGKGQKELIIGDRQIGKTSLALDIILNQKHKNIICIYCAIGQKKQSLINIIDTLKNNNALDYAIIVSSFSDSTCGSQYITPFSATSIAEFFCERGEDVLIIYDDLLKHANAYREMSLLLGKSPTREAYPSDIFYLHSRLLERTVKLSDELGGGSITSFPIVETEQENISSYITTNIISITDGQLYLSPNNFQKNNLPAIDIGKSVSRVGGNAQLKAFKQVASNIKIYYSQYEELETFSKMSMKIDIETEKIIKKGQIIKEILKQDLRKTISTEGQIGIFIAINNDLFNNVPFDKIQELEEKIIYIMENESHNIVETIRSNKELSDNEINEVTNKIKTIISYNNYNVG